MTMTFYIGREYTTISEKFTFIRNYLRRTEPDIKTGSNAECFRWIVKRMYELVKEKEDLNERR